MKRTIRVLLCALAMTLLCSMAAMAAPEGYMEVNLTKKNFKQYLEIRKFRMVKPVRNKYLGYGFRLYSKLLKQGYFVYGVSRMRVKGSATERTKWTDDGEPIKAIRDKNWKFKGFEDSFSYSDFYNYKYGSLSDIKVREARGTIIFALPDNVIGVEQMEADGLRFARIKLKLPYDASTKAVMKEDPETQESVVDYYYIDRVLNPNCPGIFY